MPKRACTRSEQDIYVDQVPMWAFASTGNLWFKGKESPRS